MENEKKPSRLGVRLSAIVVAVLLVVCMAVPAFAVGSYPSTLPLPPSGVSEYCIYNTATGPFLYDYSGVSYLSPLQGETNRYYFYDSSGLKVRKTMYELVDSSWVAYGSSEEVTYPPTGGIIYSNIDFIGRDGGWDVVLPPPPDLKASVTSGLTAVLDWVGTTVSALFSGELAGLLPLVAIPVAITILIVAIVVIKRSIWGA